MEEDDIDDDQHDNNDNPIDDVDASTDNSNKNNNDDDDDDDDNDKLLRRTSSKIDDAERQARQVAKSHRLLQQKTLARALQRFHDYVLALFAQHSSLLTPNNTSDDDLTGTIQVPSPLLLRAFDMTCQLLSISGVFFFFSFQ